MNKRNRIYIPYIQYIENIRKLSDDVSRELMLKIAEFCVELLNTESLAKQHNGKFNDAKIVVQKDKLLEPVRNAKDKINLMIELAFLVNKCSKNDVLKESEQFDKKNSSNAEKIYKMINSEKEDVRKRGIQSLAISTEEDYKKYYDYSEFEHRKELLYNIKHRLVSAIIKELGEHSELYEDYIYGFIRDNDAYVFAINIPGHLGTYQFHILPNDEKEVLYDIDCFEIQHEYEQLAEGNTKQGKMNFLCTKDEISDLKKVERALENLKSQASKLQEITNKNDENILRKIFLYSILLKKNPRQELYEANKTLAFEFINESACGLQNFDRPRTLEDERRYKMIINNLKKFKRIFITSPDTVDSKVAVEAIRRKCIELGIEEDELDFRNLKPRS